MFHISSAFECCGIGLLQVHVLCKIYIINKMFYIKHKHTHIHIYTWVKWDRFSASGTGILLSSDPTLPDWLFLNFEAFSTIPPPQQWIPFSPHTGYGWVFFVYYHLTGTLCATISEQNCPAHMFHLSKCYWKWPDFEYLLNMCMHVCIMFLIWSEVLHIQLSI